MYKAPNDNTTEQAVEWALDAGYRHIDGAARYANEEAVGKALKNWCAKSGVPREQIFVTSKLWDADHERAEDAIADSLKKLQLEYMDMYLIHSPGNMGEEARIKAWKGLEDAVDKGLIKNIGVSNVSAADGKQTGVNVEERQFLTRIIFYPVHIYSSTSRSSTT